MSVNVENLNIDPEMNLFVNDIFKILCSMNENIDTVAPRINFVYISDLRSEDMKMVTIMDHTSILQFIKVVPQKTDESILQHVCYCIAKRFCSFLDYASGSIIEDNIFELYRVNKEYVNSKFAFMLDEEIVDLDDLESYENVTAYHISTETIVEENKISNIEEPDISTVLGYYIRHENLQYVHCFKKQNVSFDKAIDSDMIKSIYQDDEGDEEMSDREYIEKIALDISRYLIENVQQGIELKEMIGLIARSEKIKADQLKPQEVNIKVATFISQVLRAVIFNLPENI